MPPVLRSALSFTVRSELLSTGVALNASFPLQHVCALWPYKGGRKTGQVETPRRSIFELHGGHQARTLPSKLLLDEVSPTKKEESKSGLVVSTSGDLVAALGPIGIEYEPLQEHLHNKLDLSYLEDTTLLDLNRDEASKKAKEAADEADIMRRQGLEKTSLKDLLIQYLHHVHPILQYQDRFKDAKYKNEYFDAALLKFLSKDNVRYLRIGGRDITDLVTWTWILTSETTERAATRLLAVSHYGFTNIKGRWSIPIFIFTFLLRRRNSSASALRCLLIYAWELLKKSETLLEPLPPLEKLGDEMLEGESLRKTHTIKHPQDDKTGLTETVFMIIIIRLLRSAREVWPAACDNIIGLVARYLDGVNFRKGASQTTILTSEDTAQLTYTYNTLLKLLSLPASIGPYQTAFHQQQAQFSLLRRMNAFEPPLIVDRRGYRGVVSMQLRHKKTSREREWAQMKAKSWPPWKEEKLGIDADIGIEHGTSRAMEALRQSWEAGYAPDEWDDVASVLSGWDTDRSPTIQTRAILNLQPRHDRRGHIWATRIQATRNLGEAWSCFLSYKDQKFNSADALVYRRMFDKIAEDAKIAPAEETDPKSTHHTDGQQPLPGDGVEVSTAPTSPQEAIYVRIPPPTLDEFFEMMIKDEIKFDKWFLAEMFKYAPTLQMGLQYLTASEMPSAQVRVLIEMKSPSNAEGQAALESISHHSFASFIRLLTRFSPRLHDIHERNRSNLVQTRPNLASSTKTESAQPDSLQCPSHSKQPSELLFPGDSNSVNPLLGAIRLVLARKPRYRPAWYHLLRTLPGRNVVTGVVSRREDQDYDGIKSWQMTCRLLNEMLNIDLPLDMEGFHLICMGLEKAIFASERLSRNLRRGQEQKYSNNDTRSYADHVLSTGLPLLKEIFSDLVRPTSMQREIPASVMEPKSEIDRSVEEQSSSQSDYTEEKKGQYDTKVEPTTALSGFLPPDCLLPRLLEVPGPANLHAFVRVLGLRRDYDGLLDLAEWISLHAHDIDTVTDSIANGDRLMRRCLTAIHVFLERTWVVLARKEAEAWGEDVESVLHREEINAEAAPAEIVKAIKDIVGQNKKWGGWPTPKEIQTYCESGMFI